MSVGDDFELPDWSTFESYASAERLSRPQWAWEYLRRNAEFRADWRTAQLEYGLSGYDPPVTTIVSQHDVPLLSRWGLLYCTTPNDDARMSFAFWEPDVCPGALRLKAFPLTAKIDAAPFVFDDLKCPSMLLEMPNGLQHLVFMDEGRRLQLTIEGADVMLPVRLLTDGAAQKKLATLQLRALQSFNDLRLSGRLYDSHIECSRTQERLRLILRILDARLSGATHNEIAQKIFTEASFEVGCSGEQLRDRVRRAIYRGVALMRKGYRDLLS